MLSIAYSYTIWWVSQVALVVKNPPANARGVRDAASIPGLVRCPWRGHGNPLQYFCLENPMDRGAWWAIVYRVPKSQTWLKWLSMHTYMLTKVYSFTNLKDSLVASKFWKLWIKLLQTSLCKLLYAQKFSASLDKYQEHDCWIIW